MSAAPKPEPGTALARPALPPELAARIEERRALNEVSRQVANLSWGKGMNETAVRSIAEYCRRYHLDPASEIDVLGGKVYRNANYFLRRGAELQRRGVVTGIDVRHINIDERLTKLAARNVAGAQEELDQRELYRIKHNIPDAALGACVVRVTCANGVVVEGANYAGAKTNDPVGKGDPGKTAETRAYRRAWRLLVETIPSLAEEEGRMSDDGAAVSDVVAADLARAVESRQVTSGRQVDRAAWAGYDGSGAGVARIATDAEVLGDAYMDEGEGAE